MTQKKVISILINGDTKKFQSYQKFKSKLIKIGSVFAMIIWTIYLIVVAFDTFTPDPPLPRMHY
ncbi:MAG TPA: hypothetical protein VNU45_03020 [Rummeliibacillus sp.]|nr:hypothetical protein [Rummeliibacillus sp.]